MRRDVGMGMAGVIRDGVWWDGVDQMAVRRIAKETERPRPRCWSTETRRFRLHELFA